MERTTTRGVVVGGSGCSIGDKTAQNAIEMGRSKRIALVAHDNKKAELLEWASRNCDLLAEHSLCATGTTAQLLASKLGLNLTHFKSGPLGGDQQIGGRIAEGEIDLVIFFSDPLEPQAHDADVKALLRIAIVWNIPIACNRATADFMISSPLMSAVYGREVPDYSKHNSRLAIGSNISRIFDVLGAWLDQLELDAVVAADEKKIIAKIAHRAIWRPRQRGDDGP